MKIHSYLNNPIQFPFQCFFDLAQKISPACFQKGVSLAFESYFEVKTANDWINLEAYGNMAAHRAKKLIDMCFEEFSCDLDTCQFDIYLGTESLSIDNVYFFTLLSETINHIELNLYSPEIDLSQDALYKRLSKQENITLKAHHSSLAQSQTNEYIYKTIQSMGFDFQPAKCRLGFESSTLENHIIGYAWTVLKVGAADVGARLLERFYNDESQPLPMRENVLMHLQLIRFHGHLYEAVTSQGYPEFVHLDAHSVNYLFYIKAYAATLSRNLEVAREAFQACGIDQNLSLKDEFSVYQLNIFALFTVLNKKVDLAYALENKIEAFIKKEKITTVGLKYVNYINLARLHKIYKGYDDSLDYYKKAYQQIENGGYTISDYLYYPLNIGSIYEKQEKWDLALGAWLQAALFWLSYENPYAMAWRPKILLSQEATSDLNVPLSVSKIAQTLFDKLIYLAGKAEMPMEPCAHLNVHFNKKIPQNITGVIFDDMVIYAQQSEFKQEAPYSSLVQVVSNLSRTLYGLPNEITDLYLDPISIDVYRKTRSIWPLSCLYDCKRWLKNRSVLSQNEMLASQNSKKIGVTLSPLLETWSEQDGQIKLTFKRTFMNNIVSDKNEIDLFRQFANNEKESLLSSKRLDKNIHALLSKNILTIAPI